MGRYPSGPMTVRSEFFAESANKGIRNRNVNQPFLHHQQEEVPMSEISKTTKDAEYREDGSKIATADNPHGETETEHVQREQSKLPNGGRSPEYDEADEDDIVAPSPPTGA